MVPSLVETSQNSGGGELLVGGRGSIYIYRSGKGIWGGLFLPRVMAIGWYTYA